ncbi:MAG: hypothetical protein JW818_10015, partial [Pirellulales bacterium]|nr:hypothetical protein [Pirellulales bacterium]
HDVALGWVWWWARALHWFNPLAWWAVSRARLDVELACDELVLARTAETDRTRYGNTLVRVAELLIDARPLPGTVGALLREPALSTRVKTILGGRRRSRRWSLVAAALVISLVCVGLTGAVEKTPSEPKQVASKSDEATAPMDKTANVAPTANDRVTLRIAGPVTATVGDEVSFEIVVENHTDVAASGLVIRDRFDEGLEHANTKSPIEKELPDLRPGRSQRVGVIFRVVRPGKLSHQVELTGEGGLAASAQASVQVAPASDNNGKVASLSSPPAACLTFQCSVPRTFEVVGLLFDAAFAEDEKGVWNDFLDSLKNDQDGPKIDVRKELIANLDGRVTLISDAFSPTPSDVPPVLCTMRLMPEKPDNDRGDRLLIHQDGRVTLNVTAAPGIKPIPWMMTETPRVLFAVKIKPGKSKAVAAVMKRLFDKDPAVERLEFDGLPIWKPAKSKEDLTNAFCWPNGPVTIAHDHLLMASSHEFLIDVLRQAKKPDPVRRALLRATDGKTTEKKTPGRRTRLAPRDNVPMKVTWKRDAGNNHWIGVIDFGVKGTIEEVSKDGAIEEVSFLADRMVIRTAGPNQLDLSPDATQRLDVPLELYLEGNVVLRRNQEVVRADRVYFDVRRKSVRVSSGEDKDKLSPLSDYLTKPWLETGTSVGGQSPTEAGTSGTTTVEKKASTRTMLIHVVGPDDRPVAGATVYANCSWDYKGKHIIKNRSLTSDVRGQVTLPLPKTHTLLRIWVSKDGYPPWFAQWWPENQSDGHLLPKEYTFKFKKGTVIGGVVKNEDGQPIEGATVEVELDKPRSAGLGTRLALSNWLAHGRGDPCAARTTDENGRWTLDNVPPGDDVELSIKLSHPDYIKLSDPDYVADPRWPGTLQRKQAMTMQSLRDQSATIVMHRGIVVSGRVTDPSGRPVAGAVVVRGDDPYMERG